MPGPQPTVNTSTFNSLSKSLLETFGRSKRNKFGPSRARNTLPSYSRTDIVDETACDDIVKYLAPTLEQHRGCSVIDVHPGACLFSSKLHDFLQPARHLLMEPEERYVEPYIRPLLDRPSSTYRHTYLPGAHPKSYFKSYETIFNDPSLLAPQPELATGDPKLRQLNPSLLVIGNLERAYTQSIRTPLASLILHQLPYAALANELFHRFGLVRMLWWVPSRFTNLAFPRGPWLRSAWSAGVEIGVEPRLVASDRSVNDYHDESPMNRRRPLVFSTVNDEQVAQRMRAVEISAPKGRALLTYKDNASSSEKIHKSPFEDKLRTPAEFGPKMQEIRDRLREVLAVKTKITRGTEALFETMEYPQVVSACARYNEKRRVSQQRGPIYLDISLRIVNLEANYKDLEDAGTDTKTLEKLKAEILRLDEHLFETAWSTSTWLEQAITALTEDQVAFYMSPQHSALDRRPFEPLQLSGDDFFPHGSTLALLDLLPKSRDLSVPDLASNKEAARVCEKMLTQILSTRTKPVREALDIFAINAGKDLPPMVPALYDVRKGGRLNLRRLTARMLTEEMIEGLVKAFFEWPFRPHTWELTARDGLGDAETGADGEGESEESEESAAQS